ncbi:MAG: hypothetical protein HZC17_02195 [Candidatus Omnitrophica bacterium]|nr:hypothetical protein [Candidatus Omnitrophota bacterium]
MNRRNFAAVLMGVFAVVLLPATVALARIPVMDTDSEIPYEFKGGIEVSSKPELLLNRVVKVATLGFLKPKDVETVKKQLRNKLAKKAKLYSPDAVIKVEYSPSPDDPRFLKSKLVYAKGEMVKYKKAYTY